MLAAREAGAERLGHEPARGSRHQVVALEPKQARGVARDEPGDGVEEARVAVLGRERRGQVAGDREQRVELRADVERRGGLCHSQLRYANRNKQSLSAT